MKLKKIMALLISAALLTTTFIACESGDTGSDDTSSSATTDAGTDTEDDSTDAEDTSDSSIDDSNYEWNEAYADAPHKITMMVKENANHILMSEREKYEVWGLLEQYMYDQGLAIGLEIIQDDQYQTTLQTRLASDSDIAEYIAFGNLHIDEATQIEQIENGTFLAMNELLDDGDGTAQAFFEEYDWALKNSTYTDGNVYWMPAVQETTYQGELGTTATQLMIREDWLQKIGMTVSDLKTPDDLFNALVAIQEADVNENGIADEQYISAVTSFINGISAMFGLSDDRWNLSIETGEVTSAWEMPGVKEYFEYAVKMFDANLISQEVLGAQATVINEKRANNECSIFPQYLLATAVNKTIVADSEALGVNYVAFGPLDAGIEGVNPIMKVEPAQLAGWSKAAFTKNLRDEAAAGILLDVMYSETHEDLNSWGLEGITYEINDDGEKMWSGAGSDGVGYQNAAATGVAMGRWLWNNNVFPQVRFASRSSEIEASPVANGEYQISVFDYPYTMPIGNTNYLAVPTLEEIATVDQYTADFETLSDELAAKLYRGELTVENDWDSIIEQLNAVGMQELEAVFQARSDRYRNA